MTSDTREQTLVKYEYSPSVRKSRKCKKSQFRSRKTGYCRKRKCGSGRTRDLVTGLCRKKKSRRSLSKSPKRKSRSRKSSFRMSPKRKSRSRKSPKRKSRSRKSSRKPPCKKPNQTRSRSTKRCRVPPCPVGMILNKSNGRCRVKCVPGKTTRSRSTGRCRQIKSSTRKSSTRKSRTRKSRSRKSRSRKSSSRKSRSRKSSIKSGGKRLPPCNKPNQTRSRSTKRCRVPPCPVGMVRNKSNGKCRVKCAPGRIRGPSGRCIKRPKKPNTGSGGPWGGSGGSGGSSGTRGLGGYPSIEERIRIWNEHGNMIPTKDGYVPPPGTPKEYKMFIDQINQPAWSSSMSSRGLGDSQLFDSYGQGGTTSQGTQTDKRTSNSISDATTSSDGRYTSQGVGSDDDDTHKEEVSPDYARYLSPLKSRYH